MHEVVPIAVRNAVSADTITFTAISMIFCFFMVLFMSGGRCYEITLVADSALELFSRPPEI